MYNSVTHVKTETQEYWIGYTGETDEYRYESGGFPVEYAHIAVDEDFDLIFDNGWFSDREIGQLERGTYYGEVPTPSSQEFWYSLMSDL